MKMIILFMQTQFISKNRRKSNIFELWRNDDVMHLSVKKIFYSSWRLALIMVMQYNE